jgi:alkylation response protein AidB-like acyl-CoA dehydrogenase
MEFQLTENELQVQKLARDYANKKIAPIVMKYDESQDFPMEIVKELGEMGFMGVTFPEEYGGAGFSMPAYVIVIEEIGAVDPSIGLTIAAHNSLCSNHIYLFGNEEQKKKYLPDLASGKKVGAWGLTENLSGSDAAAMHTTAVKKDGYYYLNGSKTFTTHGKVGETAVVLAMTDKEKGAKGISAFVLEKGFEGFKAGKKENKLGMRACDTSELIFEDAKVPAENLLGKEGEGFKQAMIVLDGGRVSIAALSLGIAKGALENSIKYAKQRKQFGKALAQFQAIQFKLADMATELEAARLLTYKAAKMKDEGKNYKFESCMAKYFASEIAVKATSEAVQIHGGYGFIKDFPVEKFYRDVKLCTIGEGTSEVQKLVMARELLDMYE